MSKNSQWPQSNFFTSVFLLRYNNGTGTCFFLNHEETKYLISAKHIFDDKNNGDLVVFEINQNNGWFKYSGKVFFHEISEIDIAVILTDDQSTFFSPYNLLEVEPPIGSEGYFFGFPYGIFTQDKGNINQGFPFPLIKKAVSSGVYHQTNYHMNILDGHNNPGFSGGPVVFKNLLKEHGEIEWRLDSVIAAYIPQSNRLKSKDEELEYQENSGLIVSYSKIYIKQIIQKISNS